MKYYQNGIILSIHQNRKLFCGESLEEDLLNRVDKAILELNTTRSAFIRESAQYYLERLRIKKLEKKHRDGYLKQPVAIGEFDVWEDEQIWGS